MIQTLHLAKAYGDTQAANDLSFTVEAGRSPASWVPTGPGSQPPCD